MDQNISAQIIPYTCDAPLVIGEATLNPYYGKQLKLNDIRKMINSDDYADFKKTPLTTNITIHLQLASLFTEDSWNTFQSYLIDKMHRWLTRHGVPVAFIWVRESGVEKGPHLHLLLHLPWDLNDAFKLFMLKTGNFRVSEGSEAIKVTGGKYGMQTPTMRSGALKYLMKSLEAAPETLSQLGIRSKPTEPVGFQRCGTSHSLSRKARAAAGWIELTSLEELSSHLNPVKVGVQ